MIDWEILDQGITKFTKGNYDYVSNVLPIRTYPRGLDIEIFGFKLLEQMCDDNSIPKNVRSILILIKQDLNSDKELGVKVDSAIAKVEDLSQDPNLSAHARQQIWELTSLLSEVCE